MSLGLDTKISSLIDQHPFLLDFLTGYAPEFQKLRNPVARATLGRIATVRMAAALGKIPPERLLEAVRAEIVRQTGAEPEQAGENAPGEAAKRRAELKAVILDLHSGENPAETRERFSALLDKVGATELAQLENEVIQDGLPAEEVRRLCDLHVEVFKPSLGPAPELKVPAGHPVDTFQAENRALAEIAKAALGRFDALERGEAGALGALGALLERLAEVELHYQRKENQLFPYLEKRGVSGPPQVMWAIHDQIRAGLKAARAAAASGDQATLLAQGRTAVRALVDMVFKEDNILFPMSLEVLEEAEWVEMRRGEGEIGYALVQPAAEWPATQAEAPAALPEGMLPLETGLLSLQQIGLVLNHLPVEVSFVDENDAVRYYSHGQTRIFPRSPGVIGRKVQNCHPPKSLHVVNEILSDFREGKRDSAEFWIQFRGRFVLIRYFAVRDADKRYRGALEVTQDITDLRKLEGEKRLL